MMRKRTCPNIRDRAMSATLESGRDFTFKFFWSNINAIRKDFAKRTLRTHIRDREENQTRVWQIDILVDGAEGMIANNTLVILMHNNDANTKNTKLRLLARTTAVLRYRSNMMENAMTVKLTILARAYNASKSA